MHFQAGTRGGNYDLLLRPLVHSDRIQRMSRGRCSAGRGAATAAVLALLTTSAFAQEYDEALAKMLVMYSGAAYANDVSGCLHDPHRINATTSVVTQ